MLHPAAGTQDTVMSIFAPHNLNLPELLALSISVVIALILAYDVLGKLCRAYFVKRLITVDGLPLLGLKRTKKIRGTAVVCGGRHVSSYRSRYSLLISVSSISGLLTARVCSDHFTDVLIIDPELSEVERTKPSARIAQYDSLHGKIFLDLRTSPSNIYGYLPGYLTFVYEGMRRLWPNFERELVKAGGKYVLNTCLLNPRVLISFYSIAPGDVKPYFGGVLLPAPYDEYESKSQRLPETMYIRRPQLENLLRRLLLGRPSNVRTLTGSVRGLEVDRGHHASVSSVVVRKPDGEEVSVTEPTLVVGTSP